MRVLFDTSAANFIPGGIRIYTLKLAEALQRLPHEYNAVVNPSPLPEWLRPNGTRGVQHKLKVAAWDAYYTQFILSARARAQQADLIHIPGTRFPMRTAVPCVVTIHDALPIIMPEVFRRRDRIILPIFLRAAARKAAHIITMSTQSRQDIHEHLGIPFDKITITYSGVSPAFRPVAKVDATDILKSYGIDFPYVLCVGRLDPRKNIERVLQAFALLKQRTGLTQRLVLVGKEDAMTLGFPSIIKALNIQDQVIVTGHVADDHLPALYSQADVFVYPALYEGFGLPVLEAMACGCPVVTSNVSSLPEVTGDAAVLVDPYDVEHIAQGMQEILEAEALSAQLRERGLQRAAFFSWDNCAKRTFSAYEQALSR
ncbi:MAG: hypothetical protein NVS2B7_28370 [Herpetosiphon sp.]